MVQLVLDEGTYNAIIMGGDKVQKRAAESFGQDLVTYLVKLSEREVEILVSQPVKVEEDSGR